MFARSADEREARFLVEFFVKKKLNEFQASAHIVTLPTIVDRLSSLDRRGLAIFEERFCHVGGQGVQLDIW